MAFEIQLQWVEDKIPRLKEIDVNRLCGIEVSEQIKMNPDGIIGKRTEREETDEEGK